MSSFFSSGTAFLVPDTLLVVLPMSQINCDTDVVAPSVGAL